MTETKLPLAEWINEQAVEAEMDDLPATAQAFTEAAALLRQQHEALVKADLFISSGIEFGFIRMPDEDTPDTAKATPGIVKAAIAAAEGK